MQGQAFLLAADRIFRQKSVAALGSNLRSIKGPLHLAPTFGAVCRSLDITLEPCVRLYLFMSLRTLISAAVRLGIVGPLQSQGIQSELAPYAESLIAPSMTLSPADAVQTAPMLDLLHGTHDRLYSRLFQT